MTLLKIASIVVATGTAVTVPTVLGLTGHWSFPSARKEVSQIVKSPTISKNQLENYNCKILTKSKDENSQLLVCAEKNNYENLVFFYSNKQGDILSGIKEVIKWTGNDISIGDSDTSYQLNLSLKDGGNQNMIIDGDELSEWKNMDLSNKCSLASDGYFSCGDSGRSVRKKLQDVNELFSSKR